MVLKGMTQMQTSQIKKVLFQMQKHKSKNQGRSRAGSQKYLTVNNKNKTMVKQDFGTVEKQDYDVNPDLAFGVSMEGKVRILQGL